MWENAYLSIKNPKVSRALKWALDPCHKLLALLTWLHFATSATFGLRTWAPLYQILDLHLASYWNAFLFELMWNSKRRFYLQDLVGRTLGWCPPQEILDPPARFICTVCMRRIWWFWEGLMSIPQRIHWIPLKHSLLRLCTTCRYQI